jgi:hypothetical protein
MCSINYLYFYKFGSRNEAEETFLLLLYLESNMEMETSFLWSHNPVNEGQVAAVGGLPKASHFSAQSLT